MGPEVFAIVGFFSSIILTVYLFFKTRNEERMELIRSGVSVDIIHRNKEHSRFHMLKWGFVLLFAGIGVLIGALLEDADLFIPAFAMIFSILIMGGVGMIVFYFFAGTLREKE